MRPKEDKYIMRALVTGGCGFIGSNLVERLVNEGDTVIVYDNLHTGSRDNISSLDVDIHIQLRVRPYKNLLEEVKDVDVIFHLGMPSSSPMYKDDPELVAWTINDAIDIFEYSKQTGCKVVYASSSSLYNGNIVPFREDMDIYVTDYYTETRYWIERLAHLYNSMFDVHSVGLRLFSVYGRKEYYKGKYANIVTQFLWSISRDRPPLIYGVGTQSRDFIHVDDVVEAFILASRRDFECEIFNVGTGVSYSFNQVVEIVNKALDKNVRPVYVPNPIKNYVYHTLADTTKASSMLGFQSNISLEDGIQRLIKDYKIR